MPSAVDVLLGASQPVWSKQTQQFEGNEQPATHTTEYVAKVEAEFREVRDGTLAVMDGNLVPSASTGMSKELCFKTKGDYHRLVERVVAMPVPKIMEEIMDVIQDH